MSIELPGAIAGYFQADQKPDPDAILRSFTPDAIVRDEGRIYEGHDAIRRWKVESSERYSYSAMPFALAHDGSDAIVTAHLTGDFPGSPVDLRYRFSLKDDLLAALEIVA